MAKIFIFDHPLIQHKLSILRSEATPTKQFRELISEIALLMCYEATRDLKLKEIEVKTPMETATMNMLSGEDVAVVPILRAGLGMVEGVLKLFPSAKVGHIGMARDHETHKPVEYYCNMPEGLDKRDVFIIDPMLATGGSAIDAVDAIKKRGAKKIKFMCIIAAPEGIDALSKAHPDVEIYCAAKDRCLDENAYILPGLGDAGDRIFGTN